MNSTRPIHGERHGVEKIFHEFVVNLHEIYVSDIIEHSTLVKSTFCDQRQLVDHNNPSLCSRDNHRAPLPSSLAKNRTRKCFEQEPIWAVPGSGKMIDTLLIQGLAPSASKYVPQKRTNGKRAPQTQPLFFYSSLLSTAALAAMASILLTIRPKSWCALASTT